MLWLKEHRPDLFDDSVMNKSILDAGSEVGDLARGLFGPFTVVSRDSDMVRETERLIAAGEKIIAETGHMAGSNDFGHHEEERKGCA